MGFGVGLSAWLVVHIMELGDCAVAGHHHFREYCRSELFVRFRRQLAGALVHLLAPHPKITTVVMRSSAQDPVKGMRVGIGGGGKSDAPEHVVPRPGIGASRDADNEAVPGLQLHAFCHGRGFAVDVYQGRVAPECAHSRPSGISA
jgi:hypothetical protein